jgi:4-amino-4-deoxy-L-arabinose transferase-like glycosyltransferase
MIRAIVVLALAVRLAVVFATPHFVPRTDAHEYDRNAVTLVQHGRFAPSTATFHGGPTAIHPPLWSLALAGLYRGVGVSSQHTRWLAGRLLAAVLGALAVWLIMLIAERLFGPVPALVAGGLAAIYPPLLLVGSTLMSEPLFIVLELAALLAVLEHRRSPRGLWWPAAAGLLLGLAVLTRGNGFVLVIPLALLAWVRGREGAWRAPLTLLCVAALSLVPWTIRNLNNFHQFVPVTTETGFLMAGTYDSLSQHQNRFPALWLPPFAQIASIDHRDPTVNEAQMSDRLWSDGWSYVGDHPGSIAKTLYWNVRRLFDLSPGFERWFAAAESYPPWLAVLSAYAFWVVLALAAAGMLSARVRGGVRRVSIWVWLCPVLLILVSLPLEESTRYRSPADPFLLVIAGLAVAEAGALVQSQRMGARRTRQQMVAG